MEYLNLHGSPGGDAGRKVLLVDKDRNSLKFMATTLAGHSYEVTQASSVSDALRMIINWQSKFDLIICEIDMPEITGFEFMKLATFRYNIPTILISTTPNMEMIKKAVTEGGCFFYLKPLTPWDLAKIWLHSLAYTEAKKKKLENVKSSLLGRIPFASSSLYMGNPIGGGGVRENLHNPSPALGNENQNKRVRKERSPPLTWTPELQRKFEKVYNVLGKYRATPLKIKGSMNEPHLTVQQIASYLQRYRAKLKAQGQRGDPPRAGTPDWRPLVPAPGNRVVGERSARMANVPIANNQFGPRAQGNVGPGLRPMVPNMVNLQGNNAVRNFVPGLRPQVPQGLIGGLGMVGDNFGGRQGNAVYRNEGSINMVDMMDAEDKENILYQFPDDDIGKDAASPDCSVNQPSTPPGDERDTGSSSTEEH